MLHLLNPTLPAKSVSSQQKSISFTFLPPVQSGQHYSASLMSTEPLAISSLTATHQAAPSRQNHNGNPPVINSDSQFSDSLQPATITQILLVILEQVRTLLHAPSVTLTLFDRDGQETVLALVCEAGLDVGTNDNPCGASPYQQAAVPSHTTTTLPLVHAGMSVATLSVCHAHRLSGAARRILFALGDIALTVITQGEQAQQERESLYDTTLHAWVHALALHDHETWEHSQRVTTMTVELARLFGLSTGELVHIRRGALLHDIGKLAIPDALLQKPGALTTEEWAIMREHPRHAYAMLAGMPFLQPALDIPRYHHEQWDGTGYPYGLQGEQIPLAARIFAIVDVWDALRSDRPYRKAWPEARVLHHITSLAGTHFDPAVVELFLRAFADAPAIFSGMYTHNYRYYPGTHAPYGFALA